VVGNPGLLQELSGIVALLLQGGGDREQAAAADCAAGRLDTMADLALNHQLAQGSLGGVVSGLDSLDLQEGPEAIGHFQQLLAGAHRLGPRRSLAALDSPAPPPAATWPQTPGGSAGLSADQRRRNEVKGCFGSGKRK
jgi:hypothetical protein